MRTISILIFSLIFSNLFAQEIPEQKVQTEVKEAIVFLDGAQVLRKKNVQLTRGKSLIKFVNLSPFIDAKSIQLKAKGELTVLSVNHQLNHLSKSEKSKELQSLQDKLDALRTTIEVEKAHLSVLKEELDFLKDNRDIGGKNEQLSLSNLQQTADYYSKKLTSLKLKQIERKNTLRDLHQEQIDLEKQVRNVSNEKEYPTGEILVKVDAKASKAFPMELSYLVNNAGWFPSYDIRSSNVNEPIELIYKANVSQNTQVDWKNVKLTFSSADPNTSGVAPQLITYYLDYYSKPPVYQMQSNSIIGTVISDEDGLGIPGVNVIVKGTSIGTVTDIDGNYSITIPNNASELVYSFVGMNTQTLPISGSRMNVNLETASLGLDEVIVTGYSSSDKDMFDEEYAPIFDELQGKVAGVSVQKAPKVKKYEMKSIPIAVNQVESKTSVSFEIQRPYSIKSGNSNFAINMSEYEIPAMYEYYCIPKIDKNAFLLANITNWEQYNLLDGEANVFFEDTYIGKSLLDLRQAGDTLQVSLGIDKNISVNREKVKDFSASKMLAKKKEETIAWKTTIKNNKSQKVKLILLDQVPVSSRSEIEINILHLSQAKHDGDSGEIKWEFELKPGDKKETELRYSVKYPKYRDLVIE
ncbi:DUF4139 domain-containing protein [Marinifilum caeruleilacunae]|uniref:Mucoidy inhibitor MuiA family protein n=1 Tax=Marinifilum caeruleilacunae TaxID=2499076 RepID=A0ABX1WWB3_9BACT|nr:DUF4139 domain-containing protein [Marinifilum caeruleilacunae]NOU60184.1 mucoidy inhibitor MuiA family protein [Marinifilum caeruleilacunae]